MIIDRDIKKYIIYEEDPIIRALEKISANSMRIIYVVGETGVLEGVLTDGDFRRWIVGQKEIDLHKSVAVIANSTFQFLDQDTPVEEIQSYFSQRIESIPLVDDRGRLVAVANKRNPIIMLGKREISKEAPAFIIAEIGNNHNGSIETAMKMVEKAVEAGADCVKFQMRNMAKLYRNNGNADDASEDLGSQYVLDLLSRFQFNGLLHRGSFSIGSLKQTVHCCATCREDQCQDSNYKTAPWQQLFPPFQQRPAYNPDHFPILSSRIFLAALRESGSLLLRTIFTRWSAASISG